MVKDHSSFANTNEIRVVHSDYQLDVNFNTKTIEGYAKLRAEVVAGGVAQLVLDTRDLTVHAVHLYSSEGAAPAPAQYSLDTPHPALGAALRVSLPPGLAGGGAVHVGVRYTTSPTCSALQFLEPAQTAGGKHPYLFSQCQAIHARSLLPCQDSPGAKMSYEALVRVPEPLTALMSAVPHDAPPAGLPDLADVSPSYPTRLFGFSQRVPIPSYLVALAAGELQARDLGPRTRVWSEPSMVDAGAWEFADTAKFLEAGEAVAGEYVWGRYDLLLLPPSFPYGGMENPCLTFVTPTLLAGDRSLTNVVAHEIAHSWTGNLVTNASWEHFWLNEGFTVFLERKILGRLHGEATLQMNAANGAVQLGAEVARLGADHPYTRLVPDLSDGTDPDDVFSRIPYEKGFYFLYYLQQLVGGSAAFEPFLAAYVQEFRYKVLASDDFKAFFLQYFKDVPAVASIDWDAWYFKPGMPPATNTYDTSLGAAALELARKWHTCDVMGLGSDGPTGASPADVAGWSAEQIVMMLDKLTEYRSLTPLNKRTSTALAKMYNLYSYKNSEIRAAWYKLAIAAEDEEALGPCLDMLRTQGRMKFLRPLYRALFRSKAGKQAALDTFAACRATYHPIAQKMVAADLGV